MHRVLVTHNGSPWQYADSHLIQRGEEPHDICKWRGIGCCKGVVTHFITSNDMLQARSIRINMLPSSIEYLHFFGVFLHGDWRAETLPRELRYMFLLTKSVGASPIFSKLPSQMEELHIMQEMSGILDLSDLPKKLEILQICGKLNCTPIVNSSTLPESIKRIRIVHRGGGPGLKKYISIDNLPIDKRIERKQLIFYGSDSRWYTLFQAQMKDMTREWQEELAGLR